MKETYIFESMEQFQILSNKTRYRMLNLLIPKAMTGSQLARSLRIPRQLAHYHLKIIVEAGLAEPEEEKIIKGKVEKYYRAVARYFFASEVMGVEKRSGEELGIQRQKVESLRHVALTFIEEAQNDLQHKNAIEKMEKFHLPFQQEVILTAEQEASIAEKLYAVYYEMIALSSQNLLLAHRDDMLGIRYTLLLTPLKSLTEVV